MANGPGNSSKAPSAIKDPKDVLTKSNKEKHLGVSSKSQYSGKDRFGGANTNSHVMPMCIYCIRYCINCSGTSDIEMKKEEIVL
ncbi:hypothetical protein HMPREF9126_1448 [Parvimonas sp. oral taxon 110 str. F0139]|nr:hypothetical protein HMPREF9126_1448 [Parvimonas sp. oral taxon 110 str. F0139]